MAPLNLKWSWVVVAAHVLWMGCSVSSPCTSDADCPGGQLCLQGMGVCVPREHCSESTQTPGVTAEGQLASSNGDAVGGSSSCPPPAAGSLVINEILADPPANADISGDGKASTYDDEFTEIVNVTSSAVELQGLLLQIGEHTKHTFESGCVPPGGTIVVFGGGGASVLTNFGDAMVVIANGAGRLPNAGGGLTLRSVAFIIDAVTYPKAPAGESLTRWPELSGPLTAHSSIPEAVGDYSPGSCANGLKLPDCGASQLSESHPPDDGDVQHPDAAVGNDGTSTTTNGPGSVAINEILAMIPMDGPGDANGDGERNARQDEFVEIVSLADQDIPIGGWAIGVGFDDTGFDVRFAFPTGTVLLARRSAVVFGGGEPWDAPRFCNSFVLTAEDLSLRDIGQTVVLLDANGVIVDQLTYMSQLQAQSWVRWPEGTGDLFPHTALNPDLLFSPGCTVMGEPFE